MMAAPDEVGTGLAFITAPPVEFVPEPARGKPVVGVPSVTRASAAEAAFGTEKYQRLQALKDEWDPQNLFRHNHNIPPTAA